MHCWLARSDKDSPGNLEQQASGLLVQDEWGKQISASPHPIGRGAARVTVSPRWQQRQRLLLAGPPGRASLVVPAGGCPQLLVSGCAVTAGCEDSQRYTRHPIHSLNKSMLKPLLGARQ